MRWLKRIAWVGLSLLVVGCSGQPNNSCPPGQTKSGSLCLESDGGIGADAGGADTGTFEQDKNPDPVEANCKEETDNDGDGHLCNFDNCPTKANADQKDSDQDGVGDVCDNCPEIANSGQDPAVCKEGNSYNIERDTDGDGVRDVDDNCPKTKNPGQADADGDAKGDKCDNCDNIANYHQTDSNNDGKGDACTDRPTGDSCGRKKKTAEPQTPDVYVVLDKSGSMGQGGRWGQATDALDQIADQLGNKLNFGLMAYSAPQTGTRSLKCDLPELLPMGTHSPNAIKQSYATTNPEGGTPSPTALRKVRKQKLYEHPSANNNAIVAYITDGAPNVDGPVSSPNSCDVDRAGAPGTTVAEARKLKQAGVKVYAIGFRGGVASQLQKVAEAGGTNKWIEANNTQQLVNALTGIALQCTYDIDPPSQGVAPNKIWIKANGTWLDPSEISYNENEETVSLSQSACQKIQEKAQNSSKIEVEVVLGCPNECKSTEEVCDYEDNDCDGEIDEGCEGCTGEVCDSQDNDCDGEIDEGCPNCSFKGEKCSSDSDCCNGNCTAEGVCGPPCRSPGAVCSKNSHCCSGNCAITGSQETGKCVGG